MIRSLPYRRTSMNICVIIIFLSLRSCIKSEKEKRRIVCAGGSFGYVGGVEGEKIKRRRRCIIIIT